jgi:hypothetical protein
MPDKTSTDGVPPKVRTALAVAAVVAYVAALVALAMAADDVKSTTWERYVYLLSGAEAIVFAAVGWIFGKEIHRGKAEQADQAIKDAKDSAAGEAHAKATLREFARTVAATTAAPGDESLVAEQQGAGTMHVNLHQLAQEHLED